MTVPDLLPTFQVSVSAKSGQHTGQQSTPTARLSYLAFTPPPGGADTSARTGGRNHMARQGIMEVGVKVASFAIFLFLLGFAIGSVETPPANAEVWVDDAAREFITPPFLQSHSELVRRFNRRMTYGEARANHYASDRQCNNQMCWSQDGRSLSGGILEGAGLLPKLPSRWNADGSWSW